MIHVSLLNVPHSPWRRYALALCLGVIGLGLNEAKVSLLTRETPQYVLGGSAVLVSFVSLGTGPGLLSALVSLLPFVLRADVAGAAALVLVVEAWGACLLYRRFGSLVFAVTVYWFTAGFVLDALVYGGLVGLSRDAITLLFIGQVFGGILNALLAETVLRLPGVTSWLPARDSILASTLQQYVFNRVVFVVMIPVLALAVLSTRTAYQARMDQARARGRQTAEEIGPALGRFREAEMAEVSKLARTLGAARGGPRRAPSALLDAFLRDHPPFTAVAVADAAGRVQARAPEVARAADNPDVSARTFFRDVRDQRRAVFASLPGTLEDAAATGLVLVAAAPLPHKGPGFAGVVFATLDGSGLRPLLVTPDRQPLDTVTLFDEAGRVVVSDDPRYLPGTSLGGYVPLENPASGEVKGFADDTRKGSAGAGLVGTTRYSAYRRVSPEGWGLIVDPVAALRQEMTPVAYKTLGFFLLTFVLLYRVVSAFARRVSRPLLAVSRAATDIADGRFPDEGPLQALAQSPIAEIRATAFHFLTMRDALAYRDALTGLPNRQLFLDRLGLALAQARRSREGVAVFFLDLDRFRVVQDTLGHETGNALLRGVSERLKRAVREGDTIARLAADEFVFVIRDLEQAEDAARVGRKLLETLSPPFDLDGRELFVTASLGISLYPSDGEDGETLLKNADSAMYQAKAEGRGGYRLYAPHMNDRALEQLALEGALRRALGQQELSLHYQPLVDLETGRLDAVEALVRWQHPDRGLLEASAFISVAESSGIIGSIDSWALRAACLQLREWRDRGHTQLKVQVNVSARQFQEPGLVEEVARCLSDTALTAGALEIEITETIAIQDMARSVETLKALRALGVRISLDDFGIGYSSLSYLRTLPVDTVKLDKSFVRDVTTDRGDAAIVAAVIRCAHSRDLRVVAEGVETEAQLVFLRGEGCDSVQGYLVSPPVPAETLEALLDRRQETASQPDRQPTAGTRQPTVGSA
jgi:diguanylate cyclase (GGDEF)-like protein